ncbi:MAG: hypothetical protein M3O62_02330 [Pseudomonadota bacterium]|nr:hypothetical protein [Pseudomonadota bacterium]
MARGLTAAVAGVVFGAGLVISGMASPQKVLAFLTIGRGWDPSLAFVMASALAVTVPGFWWIRRRGRPLLGGQLSEPANRQIDAPLVLGAALFGIGWGLVGYCPGPAIVSAGLGQIPALIFVMAMLVSGAVVSRLRR